MTLWKEGQPSRQLQYELSCWSDLVKELFLLQEAGESYQITFQEGPGPVPGAVHIHWNFLAIQCSLSKANLLRLIPTLGTVESSLKVHGMPKAGGVELHYNAMKGEMEVVRKEALTEPTPKGGIPFEGWLYMPGDGFYAEERAELFGESVLKKEQITQLFDKFFYTLKSHLVGERISREIVHLSYHLSFDAHWNLHCEPYAFELGDLMRPHSKLFGSWLYLQEKGFFPFDGLKFKQVETVVLRDHVSQFVSENRSWFNIQKEFQTHQSSVEANLGYRVDENRTLRFVSEVTEDIGHDFGNWLYVQGEGFYPKSSHHLSQTIKPGLTIRPDAVPLFIKGNQEELSLIPHFFSGTCPIAKSGLSITLNEENQILVQLVHERDLAFCEKPLLFFEDYLYVPGSGFHKLPVDPRIPDKYYHPMLITEDREELFLSYELDQLRPLALFLDPRLEKPSGLKLVVEKIVNEKPFHSIRLSLVSETGEVDAKKVAKALHEGKKILATEAGLLDLRSDRFGWMWQIPKKAMSTKGDLLLTRLDLIRIEAFDQIHLPDKTGKRIDQVRENLKEILEFKVPCNTDLRGFSADLRPYQKTGLEWLWFLYHQGLSALLCDDMGLGKTLQAQAIIQAIRNSTPTKRSFLVVCPTSVIYHWQDKFAKFLPEVKVFTFYGSNRSLKGLEEYDILLTSYGIWRREAELLSEVPFEVAIFDEVQLAKNERSKLHRSLLKANAHMRIGLTGTPIENYLQELRALFDVVLPSYMPSGVRFNAFFAQPIERQGDLGRKHLLSKLIHPFVLRRKKEEVLQDLPEKTEEIAYCPLLPEQKRLYNETVSQSRQALLQQIENKEESVPYLHVFALLARLKQICDHPAVYFQDPDGYAKYQSGKWERFIELLDEVRESNLKVVVYSQYLFQLDIIENYLKEKGIGFAGIRGSTVKREEELRRFQEDPNTCVFVASLQAAGLGIDLTAASVVIHYDRWWNAARENQATDRVHRIGQSRGVQVFKLVTRGTFEEKIHTMIQRKAKLLEEVVQSDDQDLIKRLSREDLAELLRDVELTSADIEDVIKDE